MLFAHFVPERMLGAFVDAVTLHICYTELVSSGGIRPSQIVAGRHTACQASKGSLVRLIPNTANLLSSCSICTAAGMASVAK